MDQATSWRAGDFGLARKPQWDAWQEKRPGEGGALPRSIEVPGDTRHADAMLRPAAVAVNASGDVRTG
jgi:hypothetical protein